VRVEVVAVGTELLLGEIVDTNSSFIADELTRNGFDCCFGTRVGDNHDRIVESLRIALGRAEAVVVCGGLGPTQDDITREAIAEVMGVPLVREPEQIARLREIFSRQGVEMPESNLQQADVPLGASVIPQETGSAPGLVCPIGEQVVYGLPGVPSEMEEMLARGVLPDLRAREGDPAVIVSRTLRTAGISEARIGELVADRLKILDGMGPGAPTVAFLANVAHGVKVRVTVKAPTPDEAASRLDVEEAILRGILGDAVFGLDDTTIEAAIGALLVELGYTLAVAESFTGGLLAARIVATPGASAYFRGGVVAYDTAVKHALLGVGPGPVISEQAAIAMADGARRVLDADVAIATTGVAGPDPQEGHPPGTIVIATAIVGRPTVAVPLTIGAGSRTRVRDAGTMRAFNLLRLRLLSGE
jgi:nicotinamide-nucleotide amidase